MQAGSELLRDVDEEARGRAREDESSGSVLFRDYASGLAGASAKIGVGYPLDTLK